MAELNQGDELKFKWAVVVFCATGILLSVLAVGEAGVCGFVDEKGIFPSTDLDSVRKEAGQGNTAAQFKLGMMYYIGKGVPQDHKEAAKWFRKAAEQGNAEAQFNLGVMYYKGDGVPQSYVQAHLWLNLAASQGDENAKKNS